MNLLVANHAVAFLLLALVLPVNGALALWSRPHHTLNRTFAAYMFAISWWATFTLFMLLARDPAWALLSDRLCLSGAVLIPTTFFHFIVTYVQLEKRLRRIIWLDYAVALLFLVSLWFTRSFLRDVEPRLGMNFFTVPGPLYSAFLAFFGFNVFAAILFLWRCARIAAMPTIRRQARLLFWLSILGYGGGACNFLLVYGIRIPIFAEVSNYGALLHGLAIPYIIFRYRFLDIEVIVKRTIVFAGLFGAVMAVVALVTGLTQGYIGLYFKVAPQVSLALSAMLAIFLYDPVKTALVRVTDRYLFQSKIDYEKIEEDVSNSIKITDLDQLCRRLVGIFSDEMRVENARLFLHDDKKGCFRIGAAEGEAWDPQSTLSGEDSLVRALERERGVVLLRSELPKSQEELQQALAQLKAEAVAKVVFEEKLIAILLLGKKKSDEDFGTRDRQLLLKTANQMAVAISLAITFRVQRDFYVLQAERNRSDALARLSEGFHHEIKNPLNQIRPRLETIIDFHRGEGIRSWTSEDVAKHLEICVRHVDRIVRLLGRVQKFAKPVELDKIEIGPVSVKFAIAEAIGLMGEKRFEIDNITLQVEVPENIFVLADETSLVQIFYNLIENAYHAIDQNGRISINASEEGNDGFILISVADTGKGIPEENLDKIFEPFFTTKPSNLPPDGSMRYTGTGLGLAYAKKYVEDLGGSISARSGVGQGTTFSLRLKKAPTTATERHDRLAS